MERKTREAHEIVKYFGWPRDISLMPLANRVREKREKEEIRAKNGGSSQTI